MLTLAHVAVGGNLHIARADGILTDVSSLMTVNLISTVMQ
jgi:hypothetical protein